jgi:hypothetical protein
LGLEQPPRTKTRYFAEKMSRCIPKVPYDARTAKGQYWTAVYSFKLLL